MRNVYFGPVPGEVVLMTLYCDAGHCRQRLGEMFRLRRRLHVRLLDRATAAPAGPYVVLDEAAYLAGRRVDELEVRWDRRFWWTRNDSVLHDDSAAGDIAAATFNCRRHGQRRIPYDAFRAALKAAEHTGKVQELRLSG